MNILLIQRSEALADSVHDGIFRKYIVPPKPYISHPRRVAIRASTLTIPDEDRKSVVISGGFTHDTLEDPRKDGSYLTVEELIVATSEEVAALTQELTNPSKLRPDLPRADRKKMDREHLAYVSNDAKLLKLIDRTHNLSEMGQAPLGFIKLYLSESVLLVEALGIIDHPDYFTLLTEFRNAFNRMEKHL